MLLPLLLLLAPPPDSLLPYDLTQPAQTIELTADELREISGLGPTPQPGVFCAVSDERGEILFLDLNDGGKILQRISFLDKGDFEGVEWAGTCLYAVRSNGRLYELGGKNALTGNKGNPREIKTSLTKQDDVEGLGYDPVRKRLLVVGKGDPQSNTPRNVYAFDMRARTLGEQAVFTIHPNEINTLLPYQEQEKHDFFSPSGLAVHPVTGDVYVISTALKRLVVLNGDTGHVRWAAYLPKKIFPQPEGIAFDHDGQLWISCEAKDDKPARLLRFMPKKG